MSSRQLSRVVVALALTVAGVVFFIASAFGAVHNWRLTHGGLSAVGVVQELRGREAAVRVSYPDGSVRTETGTVGAGTDVGSTIHFTYLPGHPDDLVETGSIGVWFATVVLAGFAVAALATAHGVWRRRRRSPRR